jgi:hypothetical protein
MSKEELIKYLENNINNFFKNDNGITNIVRTLLIKRNEFIHENEVRIIYRGNEKRIDLNKSSYHYDVDPHYLIEEVLFDPRFKQNEFYEKENIIKKLGFKGKVEMSDLYEIPQLKLIIDYP